MFFQKKTKVQIAREKAGNAANEAIGSFLTSLVEETNRGDEVDLTKVALKTIKAGYDGSQKEVKKRKGFWD